MDNCNGDTWQIIHVPDKPPFPPHQQPTVNVYAAVIDPKHANTLVRKLNGTFPLENLRHVKRVRKQKLEEGPIQLSVILCLAAENNTRLDAMPEEVAGLISSYKLTTFITKVCKYAAISKEEWEEQCKLWPTSYHPPTYNISGITGFSHEESQSICKFMKLALNLARSSCQVVNTAVIVDPSTNEVIACASDQDCTYDTAISEASSTYQEATTSPSFNQRAETHENFPSNLLTTEPKMLYDGICCLNPWRWSDQKLSTRSCSWHPLRHAAIVAIGYSAARDRHLFPGNEHTGQSFTEEHHMQPCSTFCSSKKQKTKSTDVKDAGQLNCSTNGHESDAARPYLCTGYDIYLLWEPCAMCAMALVHQRISRIFYAFSNPTAGALGSVQRLQGEKSLNHHYAVFNVLLPEDLVAGDVKP